MSKIAWGITIVAVIVVGFFLFGGSSNPTGNVIGNNDCVGDSCELAGTTDLERIELAGISSKATWHEAEGAKYFVVEASNGDIKVAFDACDVCGGTKGYRQEGSDMICNNCGRHFAIDQLGSKNINGGGCWPSHLEHTIVDGNVVIKASDIAKGNYKF